MSDWIQRAESSYVRLDPKGRTLPCRYLPNVSPSHPGTKIPFRHSVRQFPDAFEPYRNFGCTLDGHFPGTFFRFPLRCARELATFQTC